MELHIAPQTPHPRPKRALALRSVGGVVTPLPDGEVMLGREGGGLSLGVMSPLVSRQQALLVRDGAGGLRVISRGRVNPTCLIRGGTVLRLAQGESAELTIPSHLGYGPNGTGPIPGGATLIFRVELIKVEGGAKE